MLMADRMLIVTEDDNTLDHNDTHEFSVFQMHLRLTHMANYFGYNIEVFILMITTQSRAYRYSYITVTLIITPVKRSD